MISFYLFMNTLKTNFDNSQRVLNIAKHKVTFFCSTKKTQEWIDDHGSSQLLVHTLYEKGAVAVAAVAATEK